MNMLYIILALCIFNLVTSFYVLRYFVKVDKATKEYSNMMKGATPDGYNHDNNFSSK